MSAAPFPRRTVIFAAALLVAHTGGAYLLDSLGLVESLLSPGGGRLVWLVPLAVLFYAARLALLFLVPGLLGGAMILWLVDRRASE